MGPTLARRAGAQILGVVAARQCAQHDVPVRMSLVLAHGQLVSTDAHPGVAALSELFAEIRACCACRAGAAPTRFAHVTATLLPPGAELGWHREPRAFGPAVFLLALGAPCAVELRDPSGACACLPLPGRALLTMMGSVRTAWDYRVRADPTPRLLMTLRGLEA